MKRKASIAVCLTVVIAVLVVWLNRPSEKVTAPPSTNVIVARKPPRASLAVSEERVTNSVAVPPVFLAEVNRFITAANPYGGLKQIKPEDVIGVSDDAFRFALATTTHSAEFFIKGLKEPRLHHFIATQDASNPVLQPSEKRDAMRQWYKATGKWSKEEALAETRRILEQMNIPLVVGRHEINAQELQLKNPQGETVPVTPFYMVRLYDTNNAMVIDAEFRVGETGPGQLTMWWANLPSPNVDASSK